MLYPRILKPVSDRIFAASGLLLLSPVLLIAALAIRMKMGTPVVFRQTRIGRLDKPFLFLKFRSMTDEKGADGKLLPDDKRLTPFGKFLRSSSLDELPQLWNVARGEMSLIGPRPLLPEYLPRYSAFERRRHEVSPGITGWAQVKGRNQLSWSEKFRLDVFYVDHLGLRLDLQILWMTVCAVLGRRGISQQGHVTMTPFLGSDVHSLDRNE